MDISIIDRHESWISAAAMNSSLFRATAGNAPKSSTAA